jgi:hypothetical protein
VPSSSHRYPCWWASHAVENACDPTCWAATVAAFNVGVTITMCRPCRWIAARVAASVVVFPAPAAPSTTTRRWPPARRSTTADCAPSNPSPPRTRPGSTADRGSARAINRVLMSASTPSTWREVRARMCSGIPGRSSSGTQAASVRAVRSSANSSLAAAAATIPERAISRSTSPRMSAAFHPERRAPRRVRTVSTARCRSSSPALVAVRASSDGSGSW